jgi:phosphoribosylformylglycinamidine synthase I
MHATVVLFPGINADAEMVRTLRDVCGVTTEVVRHTVAELPRNTDLVAIPGGFSYGDYLRCGAIAKVAPIIPAIAAHAARGGYVLGVCNGFQILTEAGLLPGALTRNEKMHFRCHDVHVLVTASGPFSPSVGDVWRMPIAHGEGRYQASPAVLAELEKKDLIALRYAAKSGEITEESNPNGSLSNIAGIYGGPRKNILGLMPHPERMSDALLGGEDGRRLFDAVISHVSAA